MCVSMIPCDGLVSHPGCTRWEPHNRYSLDQDTHPDQDEVLIEDKFMNIHYAVSTPSKSIGTARPDL